MFWNKRLAKVAIWLVFSLFVTACAKQIKPSIEPQLTAAELQQKQQQQLAEQSFQQALALQQAGKSEAAEAAYKQLVELYPGYTSPLMNLALLAIEAKEHEQAGYYLEQVLEITPQQVSALNLAGIIAREEGKFERAESYYRQALAVDKDYSPALRNLAILLDLYRGRLEEALPLYEQYQALQTNPDPQVKDWIFDLKSRLGAEK